MSLLLDTHVLLWWTGGVKGLSRAQHRALSTVGADAPAHVSDITLWEIATLCSLGRVRLDLPLREWMERAVAPPRVELHPVTPAIAAEVAALPDSFHRDPADRIIVATARVLGATLLTRDQQIIDAGLAPTLD